MTLGGCGTCICRSCLLWWSQRCPYGGCYDEHRAKVDPWPGPVRKSWTDWNKPGEQAHWCRGGVCYEVDSCPHYIRYERDKAIVRSCLEANVVVYQDGYIQCSMIDLYGCGECYRRFEEKVESGKL